MTNQKLRELLSSLQDTLEHTEQVDAQTLKLVRDLDAEIHRLAEAGASGGDYDGVLDQAKSMEARFALDHPVAERFLREIIDALAKVGI